MVFVFRAARRRTTILQPMSGVHKTFLPRRRWAVKMRTTSCLAHLQVANGGGHHRKLLKFARMICSCANATSCRTMSQERRTSQMSFVMKNALDVLRVRLNGIVCVGAFDQYKEIKLFFFFPHTPFQRSCQCLSNFQWL